MTGKNVVVNNCGQASLACTFGGSYDFTHCTFANYWSSPNQTTLVMDDYDGSSSYTLQQANFKNCIFYGSSNMSLALEKKGTTFNYQFTNCLIKFVDFNNQYINKPLYQFSTNPRFSNCILALNSNSNLPYFKNTNKNNLKIQTNSAAIGNANFTYSGFNDIIGLSRTNPSDIGAYKFIP